MNSIQLTSKEIKALNEVLWNHKACSSGCVYPRMEKSKKDCDECEFTFSIENILDKINFK